MFLIKPFLFFTNAINNAVIIIIDTIITIIFLTLLLAIKDKSIFENQGKG